MSEQRIEEPMSKAGMLAGLQHERVRKAINFEGPDRVPLLNLNRDQLQGDILVCWNLALQDENKITEWGIKFESLNDGTMGQMRDPPIREWEEYENLSIPALQAAARRENLRQFKEGTNDYYRLASLNLSGFTCYCGLRGFEQAMMDFTLELDAASELFRRIIEFEKQLIKIAAEEGMDGVIFWDDWGHQGGLLIAPDKWRKLFKPLYQDEFAFAHELGLTVWFHCCGRIDDIIPDFHEIGVDVLNISQPNVVDIDLAGKLLRGRQCFMLPISYQTVSITGTPGDIHEEAARLFNALGTRKGGFVGYVEDYSCMGMTETNYQACKAAFVDLNS